MATIPLKQSDLRTSSLDRNFERSVDNEEDNSLDIAKIALEAALDKKCIEPKLIDVGDICSYANHLLVVSGRSDRQVEAIATGIKHALAEAGHRPIGSEGLRSGQWALIDYGNVVIHVFYHAVREHYDLESLWIDGTTIDIDIPEDAHATLEDQY